jgi:hypothetical protein
VGQEALIDVVMGVVGCVERKARSAQALVHRSTHSRRSCLPLWEVCPFLCASYLSLSAMCSIELAARGV